MGPWWRRLRGAVGMGLTWAVAGFLAGMGIELVHNVWPNPLGWAVDIWPAALALPGFLGGVAFSTVLGLAARRRSFDELSWRGVAVAGALGGALVALLPVGMILAGIATTGVPVWQATLAFLGTFSVGGAAAAAGSLALARGAEAETLSPGDAPKRLG